MKGDRQLPNWSSGPGREPREPQPSKLAVLASRAVDKGAEYLMGAVIFAAMCSFVAYVFMVGLGQMHGEFWPVPALSYWFCFTFVWTTSVMAIWYSTVINKPDE